MQIHKRTAVIAAVVISVGTASATAAYAAASPTGLANSAAGRAKAAAAKAKTKPAKAAKPAKAQFVHAGTVTAVSPTSVTFTVHGGRDKALRGKPLTVVVTATTKVTRGDAAATIASVVVGDHVNVKGTKAGAVYTATRVSASAAS